MNATINLEQSLDNAFERRFLYKVHFERPDIEQRKRYGCQCCPRSVLTQLSNWLPYDFSGGQIENIVRKCEVESILYGESSVDTDKILRFCQEETILKGNTSHIGLYKRGKMNKFILLCPRFFVILWLNSIYKFPNR